jgi:hypothetical protein
MRRRMLVGLPGKCMRGAAGDRQRRRFAVTVDKSPALRAVVGLRKRPQGIVAESSYARTPALSTTLAAGGCFPDIAVMYLEDV